MMGKDWKQASRTRRLNRYKKSVTSKKSFKGMFLVRLLLCLVIAAIGTVGMIYPSIRNMQEEKLIRPGDMLQDYFMDWTDATRTSAYYTYLKEGKPYLNLPYQASAMKQWMASIGGLKETFYHQSDKGEGYACIYDCETESVIWDTTMRSVMVPITYLLNGTETTTLYYAVENTDAMNFLLSEPSRYKNARITSGYLRDGKIQVESYSVFGETRRYVNTDDTTGYQHFDTEYYSHGFSDYDEEDTEIPEYMKGYADRGFYGTDGIYWIRMENIVKLDPCQAPEGIREKAHSVLEEARSGSDGAAGGSHMPKGLQRKVEAWNWRVTNLNGHRYVMLLEKNLEIPKADFYGAIPGYVFCAIIISLMVAGFWGSLSYWNYRVQHDVYQYRTTLIDTMAHDLKSPLAGISGLAENMVSGEHPEKQSYYAEQIMAQTSYMNQMIEQILELSKTEKLRITSKEEVNLLEKTHEVLAVRRNALENRNLQTEVFGLGSVLGDPVLMNTMLSNLIDNASVYAPEDSTITIQITKDSYSIQNPYAGSETIDPKTLLQPFVKGDIARSGHKGTGLGLAIVKNICDQHGFVVSVAIEDGMFRVTVEF